MQLSSYQSAVVSFVRNQSGNALVQACAGSGKTTTLCLVAGALTGRAIALAFNKKIEVELNSRFKRDSLPIEARTVHSIGLNAFTRRFGRASVDGQKLKNLLSKVADEKTQKMYGSFICKLVNLAKDEGIGIFSSIEDIGEWNRIATHHGLELDSDSESASVEEAYMLSIELLKASNNELKQLDFSDMIYLPLLLNCPFDKYDFVLVDECQDLSKIRQALVKSLFHKTTRAIFVGDKGQAIYGFTGADSAAMENIKTEFNAIELPLSISYRCAKAVVNYAKQFYPTIESFEGAQEGEVKSIQYSELLENPGKLTSEDAILCRNNAPLLKTAFSFLRKGVGCRIEGKDIGRNLINLANKWKVKDLNSLMERLESYEAKETQRLRVKGAQTQAGLIEDKVACLRVLIEKCQSENKHQKTDLVQTIETLFTDSHEDKRRGLVTLCSVHKSKGLEWTNVYLLGRKEYMPSKWANKEWQLEQERNLIYVAITRAKHTLIEVLDVEVKK